MITKATYEITVFTEFAQVCGLVIDASSIESRVPPEPDICCLAAGLPRYFELARLLDSETPRLQLEVIRQHPEPVAVDVTKFGLPERDMLRQKLHKKYKTDGYPVDLLLYYDWGPDAFLTHSAPPPMDLSPDFIDAVILPELRPGRGPFDTIWIYERIRGSVLWRLP